MSSSDHNETDFFFSRTSPCFRYRRCVMWTGKRRMPVQMHSLQIPGKRNEIRNEGNTRNERIQRGENPSSPRSLLSRVSRSSKVVRDRVSARNARCSCTPVEASKKPLRGAHLASTAPHRRSSHRDPTIKRDIYTPGVHYNWRYKSPVVPQ